MNQDYKYVKTCRVCGSHNLTKYLDLGKVPLANALLETQFQEFSIYPIEVLYCQDCSLSQLSIVVNPTVLYTDYPYCSSISKTFQEHCKQMALTLKEFEFEYNPNNLGLKQDNSFKAVHDIACNDGCLLEEFRKVGNYSVFGIEPSRNLWLECQKKLIPCINDYWSTNTFDGFTCSPPEFVTATNVLAHVDDLMGFILAVTKHIKSDGIFVAEFPYLVNLIKNNQFDTIYHEHLSYFLLKPLIKIFNYMGMPIFRVEEHPIHGGSLRIYASKKPRDGGGSIDYFLDLEESLGCYNIETYHKFAKRATRVMNEFRLCLENIYRFGKKVMAYGASAKGISLLNYAGIKREYIASIVDDTPFKQGKFTPGSLIPIIDAKNFEEENPYFIVLLAWNFAQELIKKCSWHNGYYIVPIPEVQVY